MKLRVDPLTGMPVAVNEQVYHSTQSGAIIQQGNGAPANPFIINGTNGITTFRLQSTPSGNLFDMTIDDTGHVVTTAVVASGTIPFWFTLIPQ